MQFYSLDNLTTPPHVNTPLQSAEQIKWTISTFAPEEDTLIKVIDFVATFIDTNPFSSIHLHSFIS